MEILANPWPAPSLELAHVQLPPLVLHASNGVVAFSELRAEAFRMYVCGITPYDATHLGHAATYLTFDLINRYQRLAGHDVSFVENITDIDEPLLERAHRDNEDWAGLAQRETELFTRDMEALRVFPPNYFVPVTQVMPLVDQAITKMKANGFVYQLENDLYFRVSKFLSQLPISEAEALTIFAERGGDPARPGKEHPLDAILWVGNKPGEPGWESSHGFGRPGWHIECAVISLRYLLGPSFLELPAGDTPLIDLQGGGNDLIFPHHFMSDAQIRAMCGSPFARAFVHTGMIGLDGEKMSKSKGNLVFVSKLLAAGVDPMAIRIALLRGHYSTAREWNDTLLKESQDFLARLRRALSRESVASTRNAVDSIIRALSNNLDTPSVFSALEHWLQECETFEGTDNPGHLARVLDSLMGISL